MASRTAITRAANAVVRLQQRQQQQQNRTFATSRRWLQEAGVAPVRKPVGAFRGGLFGFLLGAVGSGTAMYTYVVQEYKVSNELLTEDIYKLQSSVQRIESYVRVLEDKVEQATKKK